MNAGRTEREYATALFLLCLLFYLAFPIADGPVWCKDSPSYASMNISREPIYPMFLAFFRAVCGEEGELYGLPAYLFPAVLTQSVLWAYAAWRVGMLVYELVKERTARPEDAPLRVPDRRRYPLFAFPLMAVGCQFAVTLLNRFAAVRGSAYAESILTEGLAMPLYLLFCLRLWRLITRGQRSDLIGTAWICFLLIGIRKQMLVSLLLWLTMAVLYDVISRRSRSFRRFLWSAVLAGVVFAGAKGLDRTYNLVVRGAWIEHTGNSMGALCTLLYTAEDADAALFDAEGVPPEEKELFLTVMEQIKAQRLSASDAPKGAGWVAFAAHYADSYDIIGYEIVNPTIDEYLDRNGIASATVRALTHDKITSSMAKVLFGQKKGTLLRLYLANFRKGLIYSNARLMPAVSVFSIVLYALYLAAYVWTRKKKNAADRGILLFAEITLGGILINTAVTGALIFPQPRYMIYSMGLFYTAFVLLWANLIREEKRAGIFRPGRPQARPL